MPREIKLRVLTYNTHLIAGSNIVVGAWYKNEKPVVFQDDHRYDYIVGKIRASGAHIVALQEVWAKARMEQIKKDLSAVYPYSAAGAVGDYIYDYLERFITKGLPERAAGSGLVLLSKYPIQDAEFHLYENPHDDEERVASKGALTAIVPVEGYPLRIGMTHMWTDAGRELSNVADLVQFTNPGRYPSALMLGDFNIHRMGNEPKYRALNAAMEKVGAKDVWTLKHGTSNPEASATDDQAQNNLAQFFSPMRNTERADCIDYGFLKIVGEMRVEDARVLRDWKVSTAGQTPKWYWVHEGTVAGTPTAVPFGDKQEKLCVVNRETNGYLRASICDGATKKWTSAIIRNRGGEMIAYGAPGMVWFGGALHVFFRGPGNVVHKVESRDGVDWTPPDNQGQKMHSSGGCCAAVFHGELYVFVRDPTGNQIRYHKWAPGGWSDFVWIGLETDHNISAAVLGDSMCVVARDPGKPPSGLMHVMIGRNGRPGGRAQVARGASTSGSPGVAAIKGNFEVFYREPDGGGIHHRTSGNGWSQVRTTYQATNDEVCPVVWGDQTLFFFSHPVWGTRKVLPGKLSYPDDAVRYPERAFAHALWEPDVMLDASDHYPYQMDFVISI